MEASARTARAEYQKQYREKNQERLNAYRRDWNKKNPDKVKQYQEDFWKRRAAEPAAAGGEA